LSIKQWIDTLRSGEWSVFIKRLSANDTGATKSHQVGVYIPKSVLGQVFPSINTRELELPEVLFRAKVQSHDLPEQELRAVYYNRKTRNEKRITRWKQGVKYTPLQDPELTGAIALFAFSKERAMDCDYMEAWVCSSLEEEEYLEQLIGYVDPQAVIFGESNAVFGGVVWDRVSSKKLKYPDAWKHNFPSGSEILNHIYDQEFDRKATPDERLLARRDEEFELFLEVEDAHVMPLIREGFDSVDSFIKLANSVSNRRKSRSGKSLEYHLEKIFEEEGVKKFSSQCVTEQNKKPEFIFPGCSEYHNPEVTEDSLKMLAVKTTVKDRWRQVINEANRIKVKHLFTLQRGVSIQQFNEMKEYGVKFVVPKKLHDKYPEEIQGELISLKDFIEMVK